MMNFLSLWSLWGGIGCFLGGEGMMDFVVEEGIGMEVGEVVVVVDDFMRIEGV